MERTRSRGRIGLRALVAGVVLLGAAACSSDGDRPASSSSSGSGTAVSTVALTWGHAAPFTSYNADSATGARPGNAAVLDAVLGAFTTQGPDGRIVPEGAFGTYRKVSDEPLTVEYTFASRAVWSDGVPVSCEDVALAWLANSGVTGEQGFRPATTAGFDQMNRPKCGPGDASVTISYRSPWADWERMFGPGHGRLLPAHVVRRRAGLGASFVDYLDAPRSPELAGAIAFWNSGWQVDGAAVPRPEDLPSSGPFVIDALTPGRSVTLRANPRWWGAPPRAGTVTVRTMTTEAQLAALEAGQVQVIDPAPTADVVKRLAALGPRVTVLTSSGADDEHLDLNLRGLFGDRTMREAWAKCVPRRQILDTLVKPVQPNAVVLQSRFAMPYEHGYEALARPAGDGRYAAVDVAGARQLLAGRHPTVRIGWRKEPLHVDEQRLATIQLITASCTQAGFTVVDAGSPTFLAREWPQGAWDVALLSWSRPPSAVAAFDVYSSDGGQNPGGYRNSEVDRLLRELPATVSPERRAATTGTLETILWTDLPSLPLYAHPTLVAVSSGVRGIQPNPTAAGLAWNIAAWGRA